MFKKFSMINVPKHAIYDVKYFPIFAESNFVILCVEIIAMVPNNSVLRLLRWCQITHDTPANLFYLASFVEALKLLYVNNVLSLTF